ncbi:MAG: endonuclease [Paludibacter sp.]
MQRNSFNRYIIFTGLLLQAFILSAAVPSGYYYFVKNKKKAELKTAIHTYCGPMKEFEYGGGVGFTWEGFFSTDRRADSTVIDMYSNTVRKFSGFSAVSGMHIEHSFPKSWWGAYPNGAYKDLFHLYPADASANESKNNLPLGEVTGTPGFDNGVTKTGKNGFETAYTDNCFEPADEFKGDFARSYFYIASVYENLAPLMQSPMTYTNNTYPFFKPWAIDLLLKWNKQDPVSAKELTRIEAVYNLQGNRNPFIDYPDLAEYIWGKDTLNVYPFPTETEPFLVAPRRGNSIDFGVILQNDTRSQNLHIQGVNIGSDINVKIKNKTASFSLSNSVVSASSALTGIDVSVKFTPSTSGLVCDTLLINGGGLTESLTIPLKALASADFITIEPTDITPVGGTLQWISDPLATQYRLNVFQGEQHAGDLIIATYVEGSSWNKAIELYNGTGKTLDLSRYSLQKQSNGAGPVAYTLKLTGSLVTGKSYVIVHKQSAADLMAKANMVTDSLLQYNGNDAISLVRSGVTIDMVGQANAGADVMWGVDVTLQRKNYVTHPSSIFNHAEWNILPMDSYSMLGNHQMLFMPADPFYVLQNAIVGLNTSYPIENLTPNNTYTYSVESMRSGVIATAINTMQLHTSALDIPEISEASDVQSNQFTANWGASPYASGYLLNVYKVSGQADTTEVEGFNNIGTSGVPVLPNGWSGNASGIYTTATSSGVATPSVNLKANKEWLQTKTYPQAVSKFTYMYRFGSTSTNSSILVDGLNNNSWVRIDSIIYKNTTKTYPVYNFNRNQSLKAFKFIFNKPASGGNLGIDDVSATYGNQDTVYVQKDIPVTTTSSVVTGLTENTQYYYTVRATLGSSVSGVSETIGAHTLVKTQISDLNVSTIRIFSGNEQLSISGLHGDETVQFYSLTGICLYQTKATSTNLDIVFQHQGIFIVKIQNTGYRFTGKIIH